MSYQDLQINLTGKDVSASDAFRGLARAAAQAAKSAEGSLGGMNRQIEESSSRASSSVTSHFGSGLLSWAQSGLAGILGGVAASVASSVTSVVADAGQAIMGQLKSSVIDYNSQLENATIGFTTMLGSGTKANEFLGQLQKFAAATPFQFGDLVSNAQQMMGMGIAAKDVIPDLTALGDSVAAMGGSADQVNQVTLAFNQMASKGTLDMGNMNQLLQGGVPSALKVLAAGYHVTTGKMQEMISSGKVQASVALPLLVKGIEKGTKATAALGGMMQKQSGTFAGAMSNIQDAMDQTLSTAFRPFYGAVEKAAGALSKFAGSKAVQKWAKDTSKSVGDFMKLAGSELHKVFADPKVQKSLAQLGDAIGKMFKDAGPGLKDVLPNLAKFGKDVLPPVIDGFKDLVKSSPAFFHDLTSISKEVAHSGKSWGEFIKGVLDFGGAVVKALDDMDKGWHQGLVAVAKFGDGIDGFFKDAVGWLVDAGKNIVEGLVNGIKGAAGWVNDAVKNLANMIPAGVRKFLNINSPSKVMIPIGHSVGEGLAVGILGSVDQVKSAASAMSKAVVAEFRSGSIGKGAEEAALGTISRMSARLQTLSKQRAAALANVATLKTDRASMIGNVKNANVEAGNVTSFGSAGDMVTGLRDLVSNTRRFKTDLQKLVKMGINRTTFDQLVNAGVMGGGLTAADQLIANPIDFKQVMSLQRQLGGASDSLANYAGGQDYNARIGLQSGRAKVYGWEMQKTAYNSLRATARETNVHIHLTGHYAGSKDDLAKTVTTAIRDAVRRGQLPKNILTAL